MKTTNAVPHKKKKKKKTSSSNKKKKKRRDSDGGDGAETTESEGEEENVPPPQHQQQEEQVHEDGSAAATCTLDRQHVEEEALVLSRRPFRLTKIAKGPSQKAGDDVGIPIPSFSPSKALSQQQHDKNPKGTTTATTQKQKRRKTYSFATTRNLKKDKATTKRSETKKKDAEQTVTSLCTPPRKSRFFDPNSKDHNDDDDDDALPSPPFSNSQTTATCNTTTTLESTKEPQITTTTTRKRPRISHKTSRSAATTKRQRTRSKTTTKTTTTTTKATTTTKKTGETTSHTSPTTTRVVEEKENHRDNSSAFKPISEESTENAPLVSEPLPNQNQLQNKDTKEQSLTANTETRNAVFHNTLGAQNNKSSSSSSLTTRPIATSLSSTPAENNQDTVHADDKKNNDDKTVSSCEKRSDTAEVPTKPEASTLMSQNIPMSAIVYVEIDDDDDDDGEEEQLLGQKDNSAESPTIHQNDNQENLPNGQEGPSEPLAVNGEDNKEETPSRNDPLIPTVEDCKEKAPNECGTSEAEENTMDTGPNHDILLEIDNFLQSDAGKQQDAPDEILHVDGDDEDCDELSVGAEDNTDQPQNSLQFSHHRTPRQVSDGSTSSALVCLGPKTTKRKLRGVAARRSACAMCSTCPCSRGGVDKLGADDDKDATAASAIVSLGASRTDVEVERALMARLARLEKSAAWFHSLCGKVRRELKKHKLAILRKRANTLSGRSGVGAGNRFLDDAADLDRDVYRNPMIPPPKSKEAVQRATQVAFGKKVNDDEGQGEEGEANGRSRRKRRRKEKDKTGDAQKTLTQMVGGTKKQEDPNEDDDENHQKKDNDNNSDHDGQDDGISVSSSENEWEEDDENKAALPPTDEDYVPPKFAMDSPKCNLQCLATEEEGVDGLWATAARTKVPVPSKDQEHTEKTGGHWMNGIGFLRGQRQAATGATANKNEEEDDDEKGSGDIDTLLTLFEQGTSQPSSPSKPDNDSNNGLVKNPYKKRAATAESEARSLDLSNDKGYDTRRVHRALDRLQQNQVVAKWKGVPPQWRQEILSFCVGASHKSKHNLRQACHEALQQARTTLREEWTAQCALLNLIQEILPFL